MKAQNGLNVARLASACECYAENGIPLLEQLAQILLHFAMLCAFGIAITFSGSPSTMSCAMRLECTGFTWL